MSTVDTVAPTNSALSGNYSSVRPNSPEEAARLFNAVSAAKPLKDAVNTELTVVDLVVRVAPFTDDQGTITERQVATLVTDTGEAYASNSPTVVDSLRDLIAIMGQPRTGFWGAGLKVVPKLNPSGNGRSFISLTLPAAKK